MDHCSRITIGHNTKIVLQHNLPTSLLPCNTIFQLPSLAIHSCILQYNFHVVCFPTILQYNVAIQFPPSLAIQSLATTQPRLQYNFCIATQPRLFLQYNSSYSSLLLYNTKIVLQYNFFFTTIFPALSLAIQLQGLQYKFTIQLSSSPKTVPASIFFFILNIYFFSNISSSWKITKKKKYIYIYLFYFFYFL